MNLFGTDDVPHANPRIALYSHDTMGLGHMRRNMLIAQSITHSALNADVLMIAGAADANVFAASSGIDCLTLPALHKTSGGEYQSRSLNIGLEHIIEIRAKTICAAIDGFRPDVFIVDNVPRGVRRELDSTLEMLKRRGQTRCVLGLRDVLDDPATIKREWEKAGNEQIILDYFDAIWIYGDSSVHNLVEAHKFSPQVAAKVRFTGYLDQRKRAEWARKADNSVALTRPVTGDGKHMVLCLVGGGQDGEQLAETFANTELPEDYYGLLVTGPFMPVDIGRRLAAAVGRERRIQVIKQISEPARLMEAAHRVIGMGGYNTVSEILSFGKQALIVPRIVPRQEQLIRARRLRELGLIDYIHPDELTPQKLAAWLASTAHPLPAMSGLLDLRGLNRIPLLVGELINSPQNFQTTSPHTNAASEGKLNYAV